ncbi:hypothetical protein, partial [Aquitalea magnusonii]|uniref:hypothetical protein n=1 Tax=Aquitalea magnusonii TaxID=332411 RepID=UPI001957B8E3
SVHGIGLAWSGLAQHLNDRQRSLQLAQLRRLLRFATTLDNIPAADAYLTGNGRAAANAGPGGWRHASVHGIGLAWSGLAQHLNDRQRSLQLAQLRRLL